MEDLFAVFATPEQSLQLRELGFEELCFAKHYYNRLQQLLNSSSEETAFGFQLGQYAKQIEITILAPTLAQALRWFRKFHNLHGCIDLQVSTPAHWYFRIDDITTNDYIFHSEDADQRYKTHESAESACLTKLIEIVKNKENEKI